ncbi:MULTISPECIES: helix-turn-helix domain-containing protein [Thermomonosporaceae]|uniref:helix-turn-helix domain-containing protein n=1 Tax=Thermomonosporaceae TaxID=2012 RepID=UPI00255B2472|nr:MULTISPECIES: helix-turn-helix transcriptional regulator [Thermomonosporaceae]MDL4772883.1 helix-turn-helix transcriptional regulator [Actinomadura xylanilytica]
MTVSDELDPGRSLWHYIAVEVRRQRTARGLSGNKLAGLIGCDRSYVSRVEHGRLHLSSPYAAKIDELWETEDQFATLVHLAEASDDGDWFTGLTEYEERATRHRMWEAMLVPGLLQTPEYARAALTSGLIDGVEEALAKRLARQAAVFEKAKTPLISVVLNWVVLAQPVGGAEVMHGQLTRLLEISENPGVRLRVLERETGAHNGLDGSFKLLTVDDRDIAFADAPEKGRLMLSAPDVQRFAVRYDRISDIAAPIGPSRDLVRRALESYT